MRLDGVVEVVEERQRRHAVDVRVLEEDGRAPVGVDDELQGLVPPAVEALVEHVARLCAR